jgi:hypothetical protein
MDCVTGSGGTGIGPVAGGPATVSAGWLDSVWLGTDAATGADSDGSLEAA